MDSKEELNSVMSRAVAILRKSQHATDDQIQKDLVREGIEPFIARLLSLFLPMAYARLVLRTGGARFSDTFRRALSNGSFEEHALSAEPVWVAALAFAQAEAARGVSGSQLLAVAMRSAEFDAANQLLNQGSPLKDIVLTPPVLIWPEQEPDLKRS